MTVDNAGVTSMLLGFVNAEGGQAVQRSIILASSLIFLVLLTRSYALNRRLSRMTGWTITRWTTLETRDLARLLRLSHSSGIIELAAKEDDWPTLRPLSERGLPTNAWSSRASVVPTATSTARPQA
ncbi:MAG: hypothetical protein ACI9C1_003114 [Candidatus Aldehydirespiratoraceae bacterium]|jgi:hypothetical protein